VEAHLELGEANPGDTTSSLPFVPVRAGRKQIPADRLRHLRSRLISNADGFSDEHVAVPSGWLELRGA
jgi:hypothetical protein